jgi:capsular polysaccharide biosynthesis protein
MIMKTSIALAIIVAAICSNAVAAPRYDGRPQVLINQCHAGNWDPFGLRCDIEQ